MGYFVGMPGWIDIAKLIFIHIIAVNSRHLNLTCLIPADACSAMVGLSDISFVTEQEVVKSPAFVLHSVKI